MPILFVNSVNLQQVSIENQLLLVYTPILIALNLTVCYYHVTYAFQSESTLYSCLNVKELLARNRRDI